MFPNDIHRIIYLYASNQPNYLLYIYKNNIVPYKDIKINWFSLCKKNPLNVDFIDSFYYKIQWDIISRHFYLDDNILYRYFDKLNWKYICMYQNLSFNFIEDNIDLIDFDSLLLNKNYQDGYIKFLLNKKIGEKKLIKILYSKKRYKNILYKLY